jgi:hypothetical protein
MGWLQAAVDRVVLRLLDLEAPVGTQYDLSPDDIPVPAAIRGGPKRRES